MTTGPRPIFVYGTLTDPDRVDELIDEWYFDGDAVLDGFQRVEGRYPTLTPGGRTPGRLLITSELDRLDRYEAVDRGLYVRVSVPLADGDYCWLYVGNPEALDAPADWPGDGTFIDRVTTYCDDESVKIRRAPNR